MTIRRVLLSLKLTPHINVISSHQLKLTTSRNFFTYKRAFRLNLPVISLKCVANTQLIQNYAKHMDKPKNHGKKKFEYREDVLADHFNVDKLKAEMNDVIEYMKEQFLENVSVRSAVGAIESIVVEFEGVEYTIQDLAQINRKNPKMTVLNFSAFPQTIPTVLQALEESGLNLNPQQEGTTLVIPIPKVTREHREKLAKSANAIFIKCKAGIKEVQIRYNKKLEMQSMRESISIEQMKFVQEQLTLLANTFIAELEKMKNEKVKELLRDG